MPRPPVMIRGAICAIVTTVVACAVCVRAEAAQARADDGALPQTEIRDLHYGDVLFHFYQDDYLGALVRLLASSDFGRLTRHAADAELLAGGLYLSLGLHGEAERIFSRLLVPPVPDAVSDRARYYLARIAYQRGYFDRALASLAGITAPLPGALEEERRLLAANVLMSLRRFDEAAGVLQDWPGTGPLAAYARFNLGVAMVRSGTPGQGRALLEGVGAMTAASEEERSLRDRANLALGFALLQARDPEPASVALQRVRLEGPFTNRALLGLGWAEADARRPERALAPWLALRERAIVDSAVQESLLAVPYAYAQLAANGQAASGYRFALDAYRAEVRRIDESIAAIDGGGFLDGVLREVPRGQHADWFWQLRELPDSPQTRYLYPLLSSHEFQEGLKNYRDLRAMQAQLREWRASLEAFDDMIETRERAAGPRGQRKLRMLETADPGSYERRQTALEQRVAGIAADRDVLALANADEAQQLVTLDALSAAAGALPAIPEREALLERVRLLRGILTWQLDADYKLRLKHAELALAESRRALLEARDRLARVEDASLASPRDTQDFARRAAEIGQRLERLEPRIAATAAAQERLLAGIAVSALEDQKRRLTSYATQAQFALATVYDSATAGARP